MRDWAPGPVTLAAAALTAGLLVGAFAGTTTASQQQVTECTTISEPGTYELSGTVSGPAEGGCIRITTSDVTLDGNGYSLNATVQGPDERAGTGILVAPSAGDEQPQNVSVRNVSVSHWGTGVAVRDTTTVTITNVEARDNENGVVLTNSADILLGDTVAADNQDGILTRDLTTSRFQNVVASENADTGLYTSNDFEGNRLVNTTARANGDEGIRLGPAWNSTIRDTTAVANSGDGLTMLDTGRVTVTTLNVSDNGAAGMRLTAVSGARFDTVTARNNSNASYTAVDSRNVTVERLTIGEGGPISVTAGSATVSGVVSPPATPANRTIAGPVVTVSDTDEGPDGSVLLSIPLENGTGESLATLWQYDGEQWTEVTERRFDAGENRLTATVGDGLFAPLAPTNATA